MKVHPRIFHPEQADSYLSNAVIDEEEALIARQLAYPQLPEVLYYVDRRRIGKYVYKELEAKLVSASSSEPLRVLLLGDGVGNGTKELVRLLEENYGESWRQQVELHMTSLKTYLDHKELIDKGVAVHTGILAEQLTQYGLGQFNVIGSDSLLGWTDMNYSLTQIRDSLTSNGVWIGIEARGRHTGVVWDRSASDLPGVIEHHLRRGQMVPANSYIDRITAQDGAGRMADPIYMLRYVRE